MVTLRDIEEAYDLFMDIAIDYENDKEIRKSKMLELKMKLLEMKQVTFEYLSICAGTKIKEVEMQLDRAKQEEIEKELAEADARLPY